MNASTHTHTLAYCKYKQTHTHTQSHSVRHTSHCLYSKSLVSLHHTRLSCENPPICSHSCPASLPGAPVDNRLLLLFFKHSINYSVIKRFVLLGLFWKSAWLPPPPPPPPVQTADSSAGGDMTNVAGKLLAEQEWTLLLFSLDLGIVMSRELLYWPFHLQNFVYYNWEIYWHKINIVMWEEILP